MRLWPFIPRPFYNLRNRFLYNFLWPLRLALHIKFGTFPKDRELIYAAHACCKCGARMAYPKGAGVNGAWGCSDQLTGRATHMDHSQTLPFMLYDIQEERR